MKTYPIVLTIAGSDSGGGAGIQADIKTMSALGAFATSAITAVTAQNTMGVGAIHTVPFDILEAQIDAVMSDFEVNAVKIGMINHPKTVSVIVKAISKYKPPFVVLDPVMIATSGDLLTHQRAVERIKNEIFPLSTIITPNLYEASVLLGYTIDNVENMKSAAKKLTSFKCKSALVKGGHLLDSDMTDILWVEEKQKAYTFSSKRVETNNLHGTGCSLSSAIAVFLALGETIPNAVRLAKKYITSAIDAGNDIKTGNGKGAVNHFFNPKKLKIINKSHNI